MTSYCYLWRDGAKLWLQRRLQLPDSDTLGCHLARSEKRRFVPELASATVLAKSGIEADALATALMVMEPDPADVIDSIPRAGITLCR